MRNDLDDLASAASGLPKSPRAIPPWKIRNFRPLLLASSIGVGAGLVLAVVIVIFLPRRHEPSQLSDRSEISRAFRGDVHTRSEISHTFFGDQLSAEDAALIAQVNQSISLEERVVYSGKQDSHGILVLNSSEKPITIHRAIFNGERDAAYGYFAGNDTFLAQLPKKSSHTLAIGGSIVLFQSGPGDELRQGQVDYPIYLKKVIFVDFYTDWGNFRYQVGVGAEPLPHGRKSFQLPVRPNDLIEQVNHSISLDRVEYSWGGGTRGISILNSNEQPITIYRAVFNGETEAPYAYLEQGVYLNRLPKESSHTLTIGDHTYLWQCFVEGNSGYLKKVIFVDLYTDWGNFRYRLEGGAEELPAGK